MQALTLLQEYVFVWTYAQMPGLNSQLVTHRLDIKEGNKTVKPVPRNFRLELELQIKQEVQKILDVSFIKQIQHPTWLVNIVSIKKKN